MTKATAASAAKAASGNQPDVVRGAASVGVGAAAAAAARETASLRARLSRTSLALEATAVALDYLANGKRREEAEEAERKLAAVVREKEELLSEWKMFRLLESFVFFEMTGLEDSDMSLTLYCQEIDGRFSSLSTNAPLRDSFLTVLFAVQRCCFFGIDETH